jgi:hypothetical protein
MFEFDDRQQKQVVEEVNPGYAVRLCVWNIFIHAGRYAVNLWISVQRRSPVVKPKRNHFFWA